MYNFDNIMLEHCSEFKQLIEKEKLPPVLCAGCKKQGYEWHGRCPKCLMAVAKWKEWLETHPFVADEDFGCYHASRHIEIKRLPLRLPDEHPYLFYGIELEVEFEEFDPYDPEAGGVDIAGEYDGDEDAPENLITMKDIIKGFNEITGGISVWEMDSSLDHGMECIFRPMSYRYLTSEDTVKRLRKGLEYLRDMGALIDQPDHNGLHIHISKNFFKLGRKTDKQGNEIKPEEAYANYEWFFQVFQPEIEELGGREYHNEWCQGKKRQAEEQVARMLHAYDMEGLKFDNLKLVKGKTTNLPNGNHHTAINSTNDTIETRVFRSTTDADELLARVELVRNIAHASREGFTEKTLDDILHTKDNLFLDDYVRDVKKQLFKQGKKLNLDKVGKGEIELDCR